MKSVSQGHPNSQNLNSFAFNIARQERMNSPISKKNRISIDHQLFDSMAN